MAPDRAAEPNGSATMKRKAYEKELRRLQVELCHLQDWVRQKGARAIVLFEGRDAAGKGGTIKALTERVSPRVFRVVALPAPSDREKTQMFLQRYMQHFPAAGEIVIFDRSCYNRAGVECTSWGSARKRIPIMVPGQVITRETIDFMRKLDVKEIHGYDAAEGLKLVRADALAKRTGPVTKHAA